MSLDRIQRGDEGEETNNDKDRQTDAVALSVLLNQITMKQVLLVISLKLQVQKFSDGKLKVNPAAGEMLQ